MKRLQKKQKSLKRRHTRVRGKIEGTEQRPRLCVTRSNGNLYAQFIDDVAGKTLFGISTIGPEFKKAKKNGANVDGAVKFGEITAKNATKKGITEVVFDRGGNLYHGRIKAFADACREAGLKF